MTSLRDSYYDESYPPSLYNGGGTPNDGRDTASNGETFTEPQVTAQDSTNAAKLIGLGFVAVPQTHWPTGNSITVNGTMHFHWSGSGWTAGLSTGPVEDETEPEPETEPESFGEPVPVTELPPE